MQQNHAVFTAGNGQVYAVVSMSFSVSYSEQYWIEIPHQTARSTQSL